MEKIHVKIASEMENLYNIPDIYIQHDYEKHFCNFSDSRSI